MNDPEINSALMICLLGSAAAEVLTKHGIEIDERLAMSAIKKLPISVIREINKRLGIQLLAKYGTKRAAIPLVKLVPLVGGIVGGSLDAAAARGVGAFSRSFFAD